MTLFFFLPKLNQPKSLYVLSHGRELSLFPWLLPGFGSIDMEENKSQSLCVGQEGDVEKDEWHPQEK